MPLWSGTADKPARVLQKQKSKMIIRYLRYPEPGLV
jgi:hypothetical protein